MSLKNFLWDIIIIFNLYHIWIKRILLILLLIYGVIELLNYDNEILLFLKINNLINMKTIIKCIPYI